MPKFNPLSRAQQRQRQTDSALRCYLKTMSLASIFAAHKPLLTMQHRQLSLVFAKKYIGLNKCHRFLKKVRFTDKTMSAVCNNCSKVGVSRKTAECLHSVTQHPAAVMMWEARTVGRIRLLEPECLASCYILQMVPSTPALG